MNDPKPTPEQIFAPFAPAPAPVVTEQPPAAAKKPRRKIKRAAPEAAPAEPKQRRKRRVVAAVRAPRSLRMSIDKMLPVFSELHSGDADLFQKLLGILNAAGKGQRQRVLTALGKMFS